MNFFKSRKFFTIWFGIGIPPFLLGTIYLSFLISMHWGITTSVIVTLWVYETFSVTCRRCQFYGSSKCGLPSMIVPHLFEKESPFSITVTRVKLHYYLDLVMIGYVNFIYAHFPLIFPVVAIGSFIGWFTVFKSKRFHGLLWRLNGTQKDKNMVNRYIPLKSVE